MENKLRIAWDIDDTLIIPGIAMDLPTDTPNYDTITLYRWFQAQGHHMIIWSGGGIDYARMWSEKLGLKPDEVLHKKPGQGVDIAFDDMEVELGKVNVKVKRINNSINRKHYE